MSWSTVECRIGGQLREKVVRWPLRGKRGIRVVLTM
jgi:hypothetical protein